MQLNKVITFRMLRFRYSLPFRIYRNSTYVINTSSPPMILALDADLTGKA